MKPKLLSPVGNFVALESALANGADEVYFGVQGFNMRANAKNFTLQDLGKVIKKSHERKAKAYLAINTIIYENEIKKLKKILKKAKELGIDGVIAWDMSVISEAEKLKIPIHLSTQCSISNYESLKSYKNKIKSLERVVLARECTLEQIKSIIKKIKRGKLNIEIETFIHGAMCISVSGRCFLSQELFGRSANKGECIQPCRRKYETFKLKDPEEDKELLLGQDYVMSPKDICTLSFIDLLIDSGITSFKIEGRNRNPEYVAVTTSCYRKIIDFYYDNKNKIKKNPETKKEFDKLKKNLMQKLKSVYNRDFSDGYYMGKPVNEWCKVYGSMSKEKKQYVGKVTNYFSKIKVAEIKIESFSVKKGDEIYVQGPTTGVLRLKVPDIFIDNNSIEKSNDCIKSGSFNKKSQKTYKNKENNNTNNSLREDKSIIISEAEKGQLISIKINNLVRKNDEIYKIFKIKNS